MPAETQIILYFRAMDSAKTAALGTFSPFWHPPHKATEPADPIASDSGLSTVKNPL